MTRGHKMGCTLFDKYLQLQPCTTKLRVPFKQRLITVKRVDRI